MLEIKRKTKIITDFRSHDKDTGSARVQIALLTETIEELTKHLKKHKKDNHSRRGLLAMVSKRRRLLDYLAKTNPKSYNSVTKKLGLKRQQLATRN